MSDEQWPHSYASGGDESELEEIVPRTPVHERPRLMHRDFDNYGEIGEVAEDDMPRSPPRGTTPRNFNSGAVSAAAAGMLGGYGRHSRNVSNVSVTSEMMTPTNAGTGGIVIDGNKRWSMTMGTGSGPNSPAMPVRTTVTPTSSAAPPSRGSGNGLTTTSGGNRGSITMGNTPTPTGPVQQVQAYGASGSYSPPTTHSIIGGLPPAPRRSANLGSTAGNGTHSRQSSAQLIMPPYSTLVNGAPPPPFASLPIAGNGATSPATGNSPNGAAAGGSSNGHGVNGSHSPLRTPLAMTTPTSNGSSSGGGGRLSATSAGAPRGKGSPGSGSRQHHQQRDE